MADRKLAQAQAISGAAVAAYALAHLGGHALATVKFSWANTTLKFVQKTMRDFPVLEAGLAVSIVIHIGCSTARGVLRYRKRGRLQKLREAAANAAEQRMARSADQVSAMVPPKAEAVAVSELNWHRWSGYILSSLIAVHVYENRIKPMIAFAHQDVVDLTLVTYAIEKNGTMAVVYSIFGAAGFYHMAYGSYRALRTLGVTKKTIRPGNFKLIGYISATLMGLSMLSISGHFLESVPISNSKLYAEMDSVASGILRQEF